VTFEARSLTEADWKDDDISAQASECAQDGEDFCLTASMDEAVKESA
jgi:hypothetical protein